MQNLISWTVHITEWMNEYKVNNLGVLLSYYGLQGILFILET